MADQKIKCPKCGAEIPLTDALTSQVEGALRSEFEAKSKEQAKDLAKQKETLVKEMKRLAEKQRLVDELVEERAKEESKKIAAREREKFLAEQAEATKALEQELEEKSRKVSELQKHEVELRKQKRELDQKQQELELENQRKLDQEIKKIEEEAKRKAAEDNMLKAREKDDLIKAMQEQIGSLQRKVETGSQEAQGEALEGELQELLERSFPYDSFVEVKKGVRGADILQTVKNNTGKACGAILWESKSTKEFKRPWVEKLKNDQREAGAQVAVLMSMALPKEIDNFGVYDDVWVTDYRSAVGLATALRQGVLNIKRAEIVIANKDGLKDVVYNYITSQEFSMHIKAIVSTYGKMQEDLESEKRSMRRIWKKRETQNQKIIDNTTDIYATIEGLIGDQKILGEVKPLSLDAIGDD